MKRILLAAFALLAALGFTALGFWQIERREWKLDLIARVDAGIHAPPELLTNWRGFDARAQEYRRVHLRGVFLCDRETLVQAVTERGAGFWVLTPFRTASGIALVNRGFVPSAKSARWCGPDSKSDVIGLVRANEVPLIRSPPFIEQGVDGREARPRGRIVRIQVDRLGEHLTAAR